MPSGLPNWAETVRGEVMYDLSRWAASHGGPPTLATSRRLTANRLAAHGYDNTQLEPVARASLTDWRATQRAKVSATDATFGSLYRTTIGQGDLIGVRVIATLEFPGGKPPGARAQMSVLINVSAGTPIDAAVAAVVAAVNAHQLETPHGSPGVGVAYGGHVAQVVLGGFPQAQLTVG